MQKWNATMPKTRADAGKANVVLGFKKDTGLRMEFVGQLSVADAQNLMNQAIEMMKRADAKASQ